MVKNKITVTGANILFFIFVMLFVVFQVVLGVISLVYGEAFIERNVYEILLVNQYVLILIPVIVYVLAAKLDIRETFRLNNPGVLPLILVVPCSFSAYFVASFINALFLFFLQFIGKIPSQPIPVPQNLEELVVGMLVVAVSPGICEELLHRGVLLKAYEQRGSMKAVVITSIIFGFFHFDVTNLFGPIFLGLLIGYYVIRTNSIFTGMFAHFLNNAIAELLQYSARFETPFQETVTVPLNELGVSALLGAAGLFFLVLFLKAFKNATEGMCKIKPPITGVKNDIVSIISHWPIATVYFLYIAVAWMSLLGMIGEKFNLFN